MVEVEPPAYRYLDASYAHLDGTRVDAREIVPEILQLVKARSVIDLGCGIGAWLSVFRELGVEDTIGVDGHWVDRDRLLIPANDFVAADLRRPFESARTFDLAISTETAEHLPPESAETFVASLTRLAPVVLFSAAAPFVPGNLHLNCQWPSYWVERFAACGFVAADAIRHRIWTNPKVRWFYSQTMLFFVRRDALPHHPPLAATLVGATNACLDVIHPDYYRSLVDRR